MKEAIRVWNVPEGNGGEESGGCDCLDECEAFRHVFFEYNNDNNNNSNRFFLYCSDAGTSVCLC